MRITVTESEVYIQGSEVDWRRLASCFGEMNGEIVLETSCDLDGEEQEMRLAKIELSSLSLLTVTLNGSEITFSACESVLKKTAENLAVFAEDYSPREHLHYDSLSFPTLVAPGYEMILVMK